jgi:hypothetical protein
MTDPHQVFLVLKLHRRILQWDSLSQVEFSVFQDLLREHGLFAISGNITCAVEHVERGIDDAIERLDFWLKIRGDYMFLSLEVRQPGMFVLHDTR